MRAKYYYPDDVIVETVDDKRVGRLAFEFCWDKDGSALFVSERPAEFTGAELCQLAALYEKLWLEARERYRTRIREEFVSRNPLVQRDRASYQRFQEITGEKWPSISAWREWEVKDSAK